MNRKRATSAQVVEASAALVVHAGVAEPSAGDRVAVETDIACTLCGGPAPLCGGVRRCTCPRVSEVALRWLTAIRCVYAGLMLTRTPAALWGGALLRVARRIVAGALAPTPAILRLAEHADPRCGIEGSAHLALAYVTQGDVAALEELSQVLRMARAPWLRDLWDLGPRAALSTPIDSERFGLFAVPCDACGSVAPLEELFVPVSTYDAAIRCPLCLAVSAHPLRVLWGEPHPVGRCIAVTGEGCTTHEGRGELDAEGLCAEGRRVFDRGLVLLKQMGRATTPYEVDLVDAMVRARRRQTDAQMEELARTLAADPNIAAQVEALERGDLGLLDSVAEAGRTAMDALRDVVFGKRGARAVSTTPTARTTGKARSKRRRKGPAA